MAAKNLDQATLTRQIHHVLKPLVRISVMYGFREIADLVAEKHRQGWYYEFTRKFHQALVETLQDMPAILSEWSGTFHQAGDLVCALIDSDPDYAEKLWWVAVEKLKSKGLIR